MDDFDWQHELLCFIGGVFIILALLYSLDLWPQVHILGD